MWIPRWLGETYSELYTTFGTETFTFEGAKRVLNMPKNRLAVAFSKLHRQKILTIFKRSVPRVYRLLDAENFVLLASGKINRVDIKQERYLKLVLDVFRETWKRFSLVSFALYGSIARGTAKPESDLDILLISDDFEGSIASRIDKLVKVENKVEEEIFWLMKHEIYPVVSFYPIRRVEAEQLPLLFLDLIEDAKIIYDEDSFLRNLLNNLQAKLVTLGAKKVNLGDGSWYWDLKPDYKPMEVIDI
ncbi:MAG: nucleotidyltransferase domain-containing protein, partial [Candidatus Hodarchaeota archaeon]